MAKSYTQLQRAKRIACSLGTRTAAGYLRNRGWPIESVLWVLLRKHYRNEPKFPRMGQQ